MSASPSSSKATRILSSGNKFDAGFQLSFKNEISLALDPEETLLCQALKAGIPHVHECGGQGRCSTCRVVIESGQENLSPETDKEKRLKARKQLPHEVRLACQCKAKGSVSLRRVIRDEFDIRNVLENGIVPSARSHSVAILFCDIRNFTEFSQQHLPYDITHMLNRYFQAMEQVVIQHQGYLDKYLGDGFMAIFGLESPSSVACSQAVNAALEMLSTLKKLNDYFEEAFAYRFQIGIGIDFGPALLGEFGGPQKRSFTALGPAVNRASRIEALTKTLGKNLLISDALYQKLASSDNRLNEQILNRYFLNSDLVSLKGIREAVRVWCFSDDNSADRSEGHSDDSQTANNKISSIESLSQTNADIPSHQTTDDFSDPEHLSMDFAVDNLAEVIGSPAIAVVAAYDPTGQSDTIDMAIAKVSFHDDNHLTVNLPLGHKFSKGDLLTIHLDNRTGVDEYDAELRVFRSSYKARVRAVAGNQLTVDYREFSLVHGMSEALALREPGYQYPSDERKMRELPITPLVEVPEFNTDEYTNKIGVLVTRTPEQPHTTVMAFLSTTEDDIFIISFPSTFKVQQLQRDIRCCFAIDQRASFTFENAIEWNYVLIDAIAYEVPEKHPLYQPVKAAFIDKNPWEVAFFSDPNVRLYHLKCQSTFCPARGA
ncbi:adenylate/guanylate cyclase domain-containing protein [Oceanospirillum sanctuarii]|uniref:adenylate/guanylate cyclase domain-containing protein n=1 Tax=Oceanospirillum sanctuarii TaxID=1434821 RepID=UPI000A39BFAB|nr:adenylate/guanylate cyclase domain-containing protein [Oceanospirillum sanctuarii]